MTASMPSRSPPHWTSRFRALSHFRLARAIKRDDAQAVARWLAEGNRLPSGLSRPYSDHSPLSLAASTGAFCATSELLRAGANPNELSPTTWPPAYLAAYNGHADVLGLLTAHGADLDVDTGNDLISAATARMQADIRGLDYEAALKARRCDLAELDTQRFEQTTAPAAGAAHTRGRL